MGELSDKLAGFFGRLFPMSRNKTIKLNNEIRQTESEHFAQLCEMLGILENSLNTCTDICRDNAEQIKLCRQSLRTLEDNQTSFSKDTSEKLTVFKLSVESLEKQNGEVFEELSAKSVELSDRLSNDICNCVADKSEAIQNVIADSDKRSYEENSRIISLVENGISDSNRQFETLKSVNDTLSSDISKLGDNVIAGFAEVSKTGEYVSKFDEISSANAELSANIRTLGDSVSTGFGSTSKTGEYTSRLDRIDNAGRDISTDIRNLADSVTSGFATVSKTGEYTSKLDEISSANSELSADIETLVGSVDAGFATVSKIGEYSSKLSEISDTSANLSTGVNALVDKVDTGFESVSKSGEYSSSVTAVENTVNTICREMNLFKRQSYLRHLYFHPGEREALAKLFSDAMNREDSAERFSSLISGLDTDSRNTVVDIIHRMAIIADGNKSMQDVYTQREQDEFVRMNDEFSSKIIKLNDNLYYYNGYYLPVNQFDSSVFFTKYGIDKLTTLDSIRNKDIIDAGGYVGDTALLFSSYTDKNIHVFEASPSNMDIIHETIKLNHLDNIVTVSKALGDKNGTATFSLGERNSCNSLVERPGYNYPEHIDVPVVTLDDYVRENNLDIGLIKVDIEGGEQLLLRGAVETIRTQHPILLISIYHSANDFFEIKPMIEKICDKYTFRIVKPANSAIALETILLAEVADGSEK